MTVRGPDDTLPAEESSNTSVSIITYSVLLNLLIIISFIVFFQFFYLHSTEEMETYSPPYNEQQSFIGDEEATAIDSSFSEDESASEVCDKNITSLPSTDSSIEGSNFIFIIH